MSEDQLNLIVQDPFLDHALPPENNTRTEAFAHCVCTLRQVLDKEGPQCNFKVGISRAPAFRFHRDDCGYYRNGYKCMIALFFGPPHWAAELEVMLIAEFRHREGCRNESRGGEATPPRGIAVWTYVALAGSTHEMQRLQAQRMQCTDMPTDLDQEHARRLCAADQVRIPDLTEEVRERWKFPTQM